MRNSKTIAMLLGWLLGMATTFPANADWVNDWISQKTGGGPSYTSVEGQSFATFGGFNARWQRGSGPAPLVTFSRPSLRGGCGGIDAKMGGMWFAGINALVQKVQTIIQNAAAIMFDMALASISEMLSKSMKWVEDRIATINKFGVDECAAGRALANDILGREGPSLVAEAKSLFDTSGLAEAAQASGAVPDSSQAVEDMRNTDSPPSPQDPGQCPAEVQLLLPPNGSVSLLKNALTKSNLGALEEAVRGMVGDVLISKNTNKGGDTFESRRIPSCYENRDLSFDALLEGTLKRRPATGAACTDDGTPGHGVLYFVTNTMNGVVTKYKTGAALTAAEVDFLKDVPQAVQLLLKAGTLSDTDTVAVYELGSLTASAFAYQSLEDLYRVTRKAAEQYTVLLTSNPAQLAECKIAAINDLPKALDDWSRAMYQRVVALRSYYALRVDEFNSGSRLTRDALEQYREVERRFRARAPMEAAKANQ